MTIGAIPLPVPAADRSAAYVAALDRLAGEPESPGRRLVLRMDDEIEHLPPVAWLADGILPVNGLTALYGAPGSGKSFVALDLALAVASSTPWLGRNVREGRTLYLAAEGLAGLPQRIAAWKAFHGVGHRLGVGFVTTPIDLLRPESAVRVVETAAGLDAPVQLVVIDTLARSMIGDENDTGDMSRVVATADAIRTGTGANVMLIHHTRKDSDLERGSSALRGAVDTLLLCREGDDGRELVCEKQKDAEHFSSIPFRLVAGHGSCIVHATVGADPCGAGEQAGGMTPKRAAVLRTLCDAFTARGATTTEWLKAAGVPERTFYNIRTWLVREGYVAEGGSRYTVTASGRYSANCQTTATVLPNPVASRFAGGGLHHQQGATAATTANTANGRNGSTSRYDEDDLHDLLAEVDERIGMRVEP